MDFVVVGFGLGALGVLLAVVMLGWLAPRSKRAAVRAPSPDDAARKRAVANEHRGTGQAFLYAGGAMFLVTIAGLMGSLDDRTGALLVTTTATVAAVGILLAGYLQRARNLVPPRRPRSAPAASASLVMTPASADTLSPLGDEPAQVQDPLPAESDVEEPHIAILAANDSRADAIIPERMAPLLPSANDQLSSSATEPRPLGDSSITLETTDLETWHPSDHATGNGSGDTDLPEAELHQTVEHAAPAARAPESSPSRPDNEDPPSEHS